MSLMTGTLTAREGVLVVDTLAVAPFDTALRFHVSKSYAIPHLGAIFATRGAAAFPAMLLTTLNNRPLADFDALLDRVETVVADAYDAAVPLLTDQGMSHQLELMVLGYSKGQGRVVGVYLSNRPGGDAGAVYRDHLGYSPDFSARPVPDGDFAIPGIDPALAQRSASQRSTGATCASAWSPTPRRSGPTSTRRSGRAGSAATSS
ncbi:MAG: hypothetical protein IT561_24240 [Alphaproteobacteria bacterium]|nr:hypothetical protein [Alphaproteobacteria bacterium]